MTTAAAKGLKIGDAVTMQGGMIGEGIWILLSVMIDC
jgi:hypothetical protein